MDIPAKYFPDLYAKTHEAQGTDDFSTSASPLRMTVSLGS
jgi:hypothetical protein